MTPTSRFPIRTLLVSLFMPLLAACGSDGGTEPQFTQLAKAEALWKSHGTGSYTMEQQRSCFCPNTDRYRLTVVNERVVSGINVTTSAPLPAAELSYYLSVAQLFDLIHSTLASSSAGPMTITYDTGAGYPTNAAFDPIRNAVDDEITYVTSNVQTRLD